MSGVVKFVKKGWKLKAKSFKKTWKWVALAVAVYFTAGMALSAMPATASFAAAMPGFAAGGFAGLGVGAGATAGTGIFSQAAAAMGMGTLGSSGGLVGGALAGGTSATELAAAGISSSAIATGAAEAGAAGLVSSGAAAGATSAGAAAGGAAGAAEGGAAAGAAGSQAVTTGTALTAKSGMTLTTKLMLAASGAQAVSALVSPKPDEIAEAQAKWRGAFYGMDAAGTPAPTTPTPAPTPQGMAPAPGAPAQARTLLDPSKAFASSVQRPMSQPPVRSALGSVNQALIPKATDPVRQLLPTAEEDDVSPFGAGRVG